MGRVVGIDLGTSTSAVSAVGEDGKAYVIPDENGVRIHPSVVSFNQDGSYVVGVEAKQRQILNPDNTVYSSKRLIGRKFFSSEVKKAQAICSYRIVEGPDDGVRISIFGREYSLPEIGSFILKKMKKVAEAHLGEEVDQAVITVPAYFNDGQRQATKDAGTIAGLKVLRIINEPTSAALAYGYGRGLDQKVAIYDLGGGTFDISILEIGDDIYEVISTAGDTYLGGDDFDDRLVDYLAEAFMKQNDVDLRSDKGALQKLKNAAENAKIRLTTEMEAEVNVPAIIDGGVSGALNLQASITRGYFAKLTHDLIQRTFKVSDEALQAASMTINDIDGLILVGGSTKMAIIQEATRAYFGKEPQANINPEEVVAIGAGILGSSLVESTEGSLLLDVTPMSLGIATAGGLMDTLIPRNTPVPTEQSRVFTTTKDNQTSVAIRIFQGENRQWAQNEPLGQFKLTGLPPGPMGAHKIKVTFEIDADGIVDVSAVDEGTGQERHVTLQVSGGLSQDEVDRLKGEHDAAEEIVAQ